MCTALAISWGSMLAHNLYGLPLGPLDPENSGPLVVAVGLGLAYAARPGRSSSLRRPCHGAS
jgi:hypothetical protein